MKKIYFILIGILVLVSGYFFFSSNEINFDELNPTKLFSKSSFVSAEELGKINNLNSLPFQKTYSVPVLNCELLENTIYPNYNLNCSGVYKNGKWENVSLKFEKTKLLPSLLTSSEPVYKIAEKRLVEKEIIEDKEVKKINVSEVVYITPEFKFNTDKEIKKDNKYSNIIYLGDVKEGDIYRIGDASTIISFTTSNVLQSNSVNDVFIYDITQDSTDYTTWFNDTTKSWWLEANRTAVDSSVTFGANTADYVTMYGAGDFLDEVDFTIQIWLYPRQDRANGAIPINNDWQWWIQLAPTNKFTCTGQTTATDFPTNVPLNQWTLFTVVYDGTNKSIYFGDKLQKTEVDAGCNIAPIDQLQMGQLLAYANYWFDGKIDEVMFYQRALSFDEINNSYQRGLNHLPSDNSDTNLTNYWTFDNNFEASVGGIDGTTYGDAKITGRSSTKAFPLQSYLVASDLGLDIIDSADDSLWMRFMEGTNNALNVTTHNAVSGLNGKIYQGTGTGLAEFNFVNDVINQTSLGGVANYKGNISTRNSAKVYGANSGTGIINKIVNALFSKTISTDDYVFVGTAGGVSFINMSTRSVFDDAGDACYAVNIEGSELIYHNRTDLLRNVSLPVADFTADNSTILTNISSIVASPTEIFVGNKSGVWIYDSAKFSLRTGTNTYGSSILIGNVTNVTSLALDSDNITLYVGTNNGSDGGVSKINTNTNTLLANWTTEIISNNITSLSFWKNSTWWELLVGTPQGASLIDEEITADTTFPEVNITFPINNTITPNSELNVNYTRYDLNLDSCWYSNDTYLVNKSLGSGGTYYNITNITWSESQHNVTIWCNDSSNNFNHSTISFKITADDIAPNITINTPLNQTYYTGEIIFNITALDEVLIDSCWYSLNGGTDNTTLTNASTSINDYNATNSTMSQGSHTVNFYCNDSSNNINDSESVTFNIRVSPANKKLQIWRNKSTELNISWVDVEGNWMMLGNLSIGKDVTLAEKITFKFGEIIDNIVDGWIRITGNLNVTGNITAENVHLPAYLSTHMNDSITAVEGVWLNVTFDSHEDSEKERITHTYSDDTNDTFTILDTGVYRISYGISYLDSAASPKNVVAIRLIKNSVEIHGSVFEKDTTKQNALGTIYRNVLTSLTAGDLIKLQFISNATSVNLQTVGTYGVHPTASNINIHRIS